MLMASRLLLALFLLLGVAACSVTTTIKSAKLPDYAGGPKRLFVVSYIADDFGPQFGPAFFGSMTRILKECGADSDVATIAPLELSTAPYAAQLKSFAPDAVLTISRADGVVNERAMATRLYGVRLDDLRSSRMVWQGSARFQRGDPLFSKVQDRAEIIAVELTNRMKADGIFGSCPALPLPNAKTGS
jgi:hypothetical protein